MQGFKWFLINEEKAYLGHRISDVLTAVHDLEEDLPGMGSRQVSRIGEEIVNQIRKILHGQWSPRQAPHLKELQKIGVALMKAIDEKGDLKSLIPSIADQLEDISGKMGMKANDIQASPEGDGEQGGQNGQDMPMQLTGTGPEAQQPGQPPQPALPLQQPPPAQGGAPLAPMPPMPQ